jgi:hypothetical protein
MGGRGGGLEPGGGSRGASLGGLGMRAMFGLILVCRSPLGRCNVKASLYAAKAASARHRLASVADLADPDGAPQSRVLALGAGRMEGRSLQPPRASQCAIRALFG